MGHTRLEPQYFMIKDTLLLVEHQGNGRNNFSETTLKLQSSKNGEFVWKSLLFSQNWEFR